ncbi:hypothetical protein LY78DRAFT_674743 [Colletotrichum sublineola]|uniref:Uncharacterized protein n=1 Tax=Colletotrichum sublineola TaxID=1173701 RepID=A0A066WTQ9_COLSU|nr:hypothetical protein LY78DRAFT_674743 [Colletotrichum sublineola]KDN60052.1 hypothetical protein CSUB01_11725 [Colletotrichum sublineola]
MRGTRSNLLLALLALRARGPVAGVQYYAGELRALLPSGDYRGHPGLKMLKSWRRGYKEAIWDYDNSSTGDGDGDSDSDGGPGSGTASEASDGPDGFGGEGGGWLITKTRAVAVVVMVRGRGELQIPSCCVG